MPLLKHAKKKQRQDIKRTLERKKLKTIYKSLIKKAKENPTPEAVSSAFKAIDKAAKKNIMHDNKAAHLKSVVSKIAGGTSKTQVPPAKKHLSKTARAKVNKASTTKGKTAQAQDKKPATKKTSKKK